MSDLARLQEERDKIVAEGMAASEAVDKDPEVKENRQALRAAATKLQEIDAEIAEAKADEEAAGLLRAAAPAPEAEKPKVMYGTPEQPTKEKQPENLSLGEMFVRSAQYEAFLARFPGQSKVPDNVRSEAMESPVSFRTLMGLRTPTDIARMRTLITSADTSAGDLVRPDWRGLIEPGFWKAAQVVNLVTTIPTSSDSIQYVKEVSHVEAAAAVAEASALTGTTGTKPEGGFVFDIVTDTVKTIAVWVPATKRILSDASGLAAYINQYLENDVRRELEDQILNGDGTGENFTGILNAGIGTEAAGSGPFYALRAAKTDVQVNGHTTPNAIVMNPNDLEAIDLAVINTEVNHFVGPGPYATLPRTIWGMRVVESEFIAENTALVGDFSYAVLYDREQTTISVGTVNDDFIRNIVRVLAELRAGFGVVRPAAFEAVTV